MNYRKYILIPGKTAEVCNNAFETRVHTLSVQGLNYKSITNEFQKYLFTQRQVVLKQPKLKDLKGIKACENRGRPSYTAEATQWMDVWRVASKERSLVVCMFCSLNFAHIDSYAQWRSQDFSEGEAVVTTQFSGVRGHAPPEILWNLGLWIGISCILRALLSKIYRFEIPF